MGEKMENKIESTRSILNELVCRDDANLYEGEILALSVQLDTLIATYYEKSPI